MNHLKTKTIQKQRTILEGTLLGVLLLFLLHVVSGCGPNHAGGNVHSHDTNKHPEQYNDQHAEAKANFSKQLGGWGTSTGELFLSKLKEDAEGAKSKKKTGKINGVESYKLPESSPNDGKMSYFDGLLKEQIVANENAHKKLKKNIRKGKAEVQFDQENGPSGIFEKIATIGLASKNSFSRGTGIYVVYQYMHFIDKARKIMDNQESKEAKQRDLNNELEKLRGRLKMVAPETKGIILIIPVDTESYTPEASASEAEKQAGVYFVERVKPKRTERKKNFTLAKDEQAKFEVINNEIEKMIDEFIQSL